MNILKKRAGFTAVHAVMAVGLVIIVVLAFFGLPHGVKDFFAKFTGKSGGLASISSFGDFGAEGDGNLANLNIDEVAKTIYTDLANVQAATKSESEENIKNGVCFKNPANDQDFYNIVSGVKNGNACADGEAIKTVISLPGTTIFTDPASSLNKYVVFNHDGTITSDKDVSIKISNSTGVRMVVVTPEGVITYTDKISGTLSGAGSGLNSGANSVNAAEAARLASIASGLSNVLTGIQNLQNQSITTQVNLPGVPSIGASSSNGQIYLSWSQPSTPAGYPVLGYRLYRGTVPNGEVLISTVGPNTYTDYSLISGVYYYKVAAVNRNGEGPKSNEAVIALSNQASFGQSSTIAPSQPVLYASMAGSNQVVLNWTVSSQGSSQIIAYKVYRGGSLIAETAGTNYVDSSVNANTTYCYSVSARNSQMESSVSNSQCITTNTVVSLQVPSAPSLSGTAQNGQATLNWTASSAGSSSIIEYKVYRSYVSGGSLELVGATAGNSMVVSSLVNGTNYYFKVRARNSQGEGNLSNELLMIPASSLSQIPSSEQCPQTPCTPSNFKATAEVGRVVLSWSAPYQGGSSIIEYKVYRSADKRNTFIGSTGGNSYTDTSAERGVSYTYYVTARNFYGESVWAIDYTIAK